MNVTQLADKFKQDAWSEVRLVTPEQARKWRETSHFERQRTISNANVERLAHEMTKGRFIVGTQVYMAVLPDGTDRIINGNHTLEAVVASGIPQPLTITRKNVRDLDEAGRIYAVFDLQKTRTLADSLRAVGRSTDISNSTKVASAVGAISENFNSGSKRGVPRLERLELMEEYRDAAELFAGCIAQCPKDSVKIVTRAPIMAVALYTLRYQPSMAIDFWRTIARDDGLKVGMPERSLLGWARNAVSSGHIARRDHCRAAALAWNAAFRNETLQVCKPRQMAGFFILGTPISHGFPDEE